jgi:hypothetical protein
VRSVAARLAFAAPLSTFSRLRVGSSGSSLRTPRVCRLTKRRVPHDLRSPSERPVPMRGAEQPLPTAGHLASRGIHLVVCPSSDIPRPRPLRVTLPPPSVCWCQPTDSFRPRGFSPPRRFPPRSRSRACCIPVPEGVRSVSRSRAPLQSTRRSLVRCARGFPVCAFTPLEEVPSPAAVAHPCAPLPPRRFYDLEALLRG